MADLSDVENTVVSTIAGVLYPGGTQVPSATGEVVKIFRGWPSNIGLNADLGGGISNVSVFSDPKSTRETTRYPRVWRESGRVPRTLFVDVSGSSIAISGTPMVGQILGVEVDGQPYTLAVASGDDPAALAMKLASLIGNATASGSVLSLDDPTSIVARVVEGGRASMEMRRQEQDVLIGVWCPTPQARDTLASVIDLALSQIDWLQFQDGSAGLLRYRSTVEVDSSENANLYRRDLVYLIEYPTVVTATLPAMIFGRLITTEIVQEAATAITGCSANEPVRLGAIRFDAWYDPSSTIDQQCAAALSNPLWNDRLPPNAVVDGGQVGWALAMQATLDAEIVAAGVAGIDFWAFDSYAPNDGLSRALGLYLSSAIRDQVQFCMLGQSSNWGDITSSTGYSTAFLGDLTMMAEPGYVTVLGGRPLYLVLDAAPEQLSNLPSGGLEQAIAYVREVATSRGLANPYVVWLSAAALADYDNAGVAASLGADAAGAYATPRLNGRGSDLRKPGFRRSDRLVSSRRGRFRHGRNRDDRLGSTTAHRRAAAILPDSADHRPRRLLHRGGARRYRHPRGGAQAVHERQSIAVPGWYRPDLCLERARGGWLAHADPWTVRVTAAARHSSRRGTAEPRSYGHGRRNSRYLKRDNMLGSSRQVAIVVHPFAGYAKGDIISDPAQLAALRQSGQGSFIVYTHIPAPAASGADTEETH